MMVWIIGCGGMLGRELVSLCERDGIFFLGTDIECDITDMNALGAFASGKKIDWVVNCSAFTAVDKAEDEEDRAFAINAIGAGNVASIANDISASLVHLSTDYVFDGSGSRPYTEKDPVSPLGAYGRTKLAGEQFVAARCRRAIIIRTAWLYGEHGANFVHTMLRLFSERDVVKVVGDQKGSPTWSYDLANLILSCVKGQIAEYGIYHFTNDGETNWYSFSCEIYKIAREIGIIDREVDIVRITSDEYPSKVKRPAYSVLSKEKIRALGINPPRWEDSLRAFLESKKIKWN
jgi:dTDP-4-dehydrorhamnose reductase